MHCRHCGFGNGEDDHRCLRCGRRLKEAAVAASAGFSGANALAVAPHALNETQGLNDTHSLNEGRDDTREFSPQTVLFASPARNVIPFEQFRRQTSPPAGPKQSQAIRKGKAPRRPTAPTVVQGTLDFVPPAPAKNRRLKTDVDAQIFCDQAVATPTHRSVAAAIDGALIFMGCWLLVTIFEAMGGRFGAGKISWLAMGGLFGLVSMFYGLIWAIAGRETLGMRFTDLQLITFDGFPLDPRSRALRFASTCLSFCSGGLGVLWAVADEENLTWHDHISKTFPTIREEPGTFVKQKR